MIDIDKELFTTQIKEGFTIPQLEEYWGCSRTVTTNRKVKWGLVGISPNYTKIDRIKGTKVCNTCKIEKPLTDFYSNGYYKDTKKYKASCKLCEKQVSRTKYIERVSSILKDLGRGYECEVCGYNKNYAALQFHHYTKEKNFEISSSRTRNYKGLKEEIKICRLLCANCHAEEHNPAWAINSVK